MSPARSWRATTTASRTQACSPSRAAISRLDAEAADLHLLVVAAQKLQIAVRQIARQVAGPVHPRPCLIAERIGQEPLRRQLGAVQVATRNPCPADVKLTHRPERYGRTMTVQQVHPRVGNRAADRLNNSLSPWHANPSRVRRCLGRGVQITDLLYATALEDPLDQICLQPLTRQIDHACRSRHGLLVDQSGDRRGHRVDQGDIQGRLRQRQCILDKIKRASLRQRNEALIDGQIKTDRGRKQRAADL
ncbi:hypothetical protein AJ87_00115 [Rhizobium yanglingense]|nr:hypothetical protein AJ87_00115 [Rhizobium yanglingense]